MRKKCCRYGQQRLFKSLHWREYIDALYDVLVYRCISGPLRHCHKIVERWSVSRISQDRRVQLVQHSDVYKLNVSNEMS